MKNEYRLKRIHFSVFLTKIDAVNFSSKNQAHLAVKMFVAVVNYLFCPFPRHRLTQCVNQARFLTTWPPIPKKTIPLFFHLLQKSYYNFNHLPCALPNGMGYGIYELLSSSYLFS